MRSTPHKARNRLAGGLLLFVPFLALGPPAASAQFEAKMEASSSTVQAGVPFLLEIKVNTARADLEALPKADGLEILSSGSQTNVTMDGARVSRSLTYRFQAVARKEGEMRIAAVPIRTTGGTIQSNPLDLTVTAGAVQPGTGSGRQPDPGDNPPDIVFAKVVPQKKSAFVGEMVPVDVTVYFRSDIGVRHVQDQITLSGENLTTNKSGEPERGMAESGGHSFKTFTFHTAVAALKPGQLTIDPLDIETVISFQEKRRMSSIFGDDPFFRGGLRSPFEDEFFNRALSMPVTRQVIVKTDPATLTAVALPQEGRPSGFAGAVGKFSLTLSPDRTEVKAGEPVTFTAKVRGIGNFDRVTSLAIESGEDWQSYPAKARFESADPTMTSGEKVFTQVMVPRRQGEASPQFRLDYFDPEEKGYATLRTSHPPIAVSGTAIIAGGTNGAGPEDGGTAPSGILHIKTQAPASWRFARAPLAGSTLFWAGNGTLALAAAALFLFRLRRNRPGREEREAETRRARRLRALLRALEQPDLTDLDFCAKASEAITLCSPNGQNRTPEEVISLAGPGFPGAQALLEIARASGRGRYGALRAPAEEIDRRTSLDALGELERALSATAEGAPTRSVRPQTAGRRPSRLQSLLFLLLLGVHHTAAAAAPSASEATQRFESANRLYESGKFKEAAEAYGKLVENGALHADLFYNLGNAWLKADEPARAVLNFRRALLLDPGHKEALQNWRAVAAEDASLKPPRSPILPFVPALPDNLLLLLTGLAVWTAAFALVLGATRRHAPGTPPVSRRCLRIAAAAAGAACLLPAFFLLNRWRSPPRSVHMTVGETPVRTAPYADANSLASLDPGADVRVLRRRGPWSYVQLATERTGWVAGNSIEQVRLW